MGPSEVSCRHEEASPQSTADGSYCRGNHSDLYPDEPRLSNEPETQRSEAKARGFTSKSIFLICFEILFPIMALFKDVASSETRESCDCELVELCVSPTKKIRCSPNPEHLKM